MVEAADRAGVIELGLASEIQFPHFDGNVVHAVRLQPNLRGYRLSIDGFALNNTEIEVAELRLRGFSNKEIARLMHKKPRRIKEVLDQATERNHSGDWREMIFRAQELGFFDSEFLRSMTEMAQRAEDLIS